MAKSFRNLVREEARELPLYLPGKPIEEVKRELGLVDVIKLASNENAWGPSPLAVKAMQEAITESNRYPDASAFELTTALTESFGLDKKHFLVGNGSDQIIQMLAQTFFRAGDEVLMGKPSFPRYATVARLMGAIPVEIPCSEGYYPLQQLLDGVTDKTRAIFICNPNNPTGTAYTEPELRAFVEAVPPNIIIIFDEAYLEFADSPNSGVAFLSDDRPLLVLRTFSKAYGLAGVRIGFAIGHPDLIEGLDRVRDPFNASVPALAGALAAWQDQDYINEIISKNKIERTRLNAALEQLGVSFFPSQTNFIMAFFKEPANQLSDKLLREGIIVRPGVGFGYPDGIRITIGTKEENERLLAALRGTMIEARCSN